MNSSAAEPQGPIRTPLPNPLPFERGEGEATPRSLSALIQRQWGRGEGADLGFRDPKRVRMSGGLSPLVPRGERETMRTLAFPRGLL